MALDDDMTTPPTEPDSGTPADRAEGSVPEDGYLGREEGSGVDDPTSVPDGDPDEDSRFA